MKSDVKEKMTVEKHSSHEPKSHQRDAHEVFVEKRTAIFLAHGKISRSELFRRLVSMPFL
jgi:hypothetical protein